MMASRQVESIIFFRCLFYMCRKCIENTEEIKKISLKKYHQFKTL